ncbi:hypothetical protein CYMTET_36441, partial [Cymbomonas tetramitiformis]
MQPLSSVAWPWPPALNALRRWALTAQWGALGCRIIVRLDGLRVRPSCNLALVPLIGRLSPVGRGLGGLGAQFVVESITSSIRASSAAVSILFCVGVVLSIIGVQLFAGAFYVCNDLSIDTEEECTGTFEEFNDESNDYVMTDRRWDHAVRYHYDNIYNGLLTTLELMTGEMWPDIMLAGVDHVGPGKAMKKNSSEWAAIYFISVLMIMNVFFLNMIIGIVVECASKLKDERKYPGLAPVLKEWMLTLRGLSCVKPLPHRHPPENKFRKEMHLLVHSFLFQKFIYWAITLNCFQMTLGYYGQSDEWAASLERVSVVFSVVFMVELILKLIALGRDYFKSYENLFDFCIIIVSCIGFIAPVSLNFLQAFRVLRLIRIARKIKGAIALPLPQDSHTGIGQ